MSCSSARIWLLVSSILILCAAGCGGSQAPAMTQTTKAATQIASSPTKPMGDNAPAADVSADGAREPAAASAVGNERPTAAAPAESPAESSGPNDRLRDISFDDIKFDMKKDAPFDRSLLTDKIEALDGKRVRIRGYILPSFQQTGLTQFVLVRDNLSCCFGPGAAIYDCVIVEMKPGLSTDYSLYPVAVDGTFTVREMVDPDGKTLAIYHLDGEQVR
jgi:hypothetical protein